jgi:hypothetical protein
MCVFWMLENERVQTKSFALLSQGRRLLSQGKMDDALGLYEASIAVPSSPAASWSALDSPKVNIGPYI